MNTQNISRRKFIKAAGFTLGGAALVFSSTGCGPAQIKDDQGQSAENSEIGTPILTFGKEPSTNGRILVVYATRTGSTVGVASAIGETLAGLGFSVDVKPAQGNPSIGGYQAVVIGSAVNGGKWLPEAAEFVKNNQEALNELPVALFCVHIMNLGEDESSKKNRLAYLNDIRSMVKPVDEGYFAGMGMKADEQSGLVRWVYRTFKIGPEGDCRDWEKIRGWAKTAPL